MFKKSVHQYLILFLEFLCVSVIASIVNFVRGCKDYGSENSAD